MSDIELVIKIPDDVYEIIKNGTDIEIHFGEHIVVKDEWASERIRNGTPLPKGHGTLKDTDELYSIFKEKCDAYNIDNLSFISDMDMNFELAPTIIEADKMERR